MIATKVRIPLIEIFIVSFARSVSVELDGFMVYEEPFESPLVQAPMAGQS